MITVTQFCEYTKSHFKWVNCMVYELYRNKAVEILVKTKMDSKWIKGQNVKGKTMRLIKENVRGHPCDPGMGKDLNKTLKRQTTK